MCFWGWKQEIWEAISKKEMNSISLVRWREIKGLDGSSVESELWLGLWDAWMMLQPPLLLLILLVSVIKGRKEQYQPCIYIMPVHFHLTVCHIWVYAYTEESIMLTPYLAFLYRSIFCADIPVLSSLHLNHNCIHPWKTFPLPNSQGSEEISESLLLLFSFQSSTITCINHNSSLSHFFPVCIIPRWHFYLLCKNIFKRLFIWSTRLCHGYPFRT